MKSLGILSNDIVLVNTFKASNRFEVVEHISHENLSETKHDVLIISDRVTAFSELKKILSSMEGKKCFYMISSENFTNLSEAIIHSEGVVMVPPRLTKEQILNFVFQKLNRNLFSRNKVFTFFGADSKVGTTMVAQSVSTNLAKVTEKVLFIPLDGKTGGDYVDFDSKFGLGEIKSRLQSKIISQTELLDICVKTNCGYNILPGVKSILARRQFHPEDIVHLLDLAQSLYDIIIVDAGSDIELGMTVAALNSTPNRFLVTTQQDIARERYDSLRDQVLSKMSIDKFLLIVNKHFENSALVNQSKMEESYGASMIAALPFVEYGWQCEQDKTTLMSYNNNEYKIGIDDISKIISSHVGIEWVSSQKRERWFMRKLFSVKRNEHSYGTAI